MGCEKIVKDLHYQRGFTENKVICRRRLGQKGELSFMYDLRWVGRERGRAGSIQGKEETDLQCGGS